MSRRMAPAILALALAGAAFTAAAFSSAAPGTSESQAAVPAISPPRTPLPPESESAGVARFSFIAYGDTRGRRDGVDLQYEHSLIVDSILKTIKRMEGGPDPVRFIVQTGDAVVNGGDAKQWNVSFVGLINRLTTEGGVAYFIAPGNHDVSEAPDPNAPERQGGLRNYLSAMSRLIPPDGASRRLAGYPTYAFGYGNTFVIAFDSNLASDTVQFEWIKAQLEGLDRKRWVNVVAVFHHPVFSSGPHGGPIVESQTRTLRTLYMPLFRRYQVRFLLAGHDHLFDHWIERYQDRSGVSRRIDQIVTGGGGAPLYAYEGEPDLEGYEKDSAGEKVKVEHFARPGPKAGDNPYHYAIVHVDGVRIRLDVVGVDWGRDFKPYRSATTSIGDGSGGD